MGSSPPPRPSLSSPLSPRTVGRVGIPSGEGARIGGGRAQDVGGWLQLWGLTLLVAVAGMVVLAPLAPTGLPNGDAAVYAQQIAARNFVERPVHLGYYVVGAVVLGFSDSFTDRALNLVSTAFAAATLGLVFLATALATGRRGLGVAAAASLLGHLPFLENAIWAEVYMMQTFFLLSAAWLFWRYGGRLAGAVGSGLALAGSVLVTPSSLFAVPCLVVGRPRWRAVAFLGAIGGIVTLASLSFVWRDYLWGNRGLLTAGAERISFPDAILKEGFEGLFAVGSLLPFLLLGVVALLSSRRGRVFAAAWATLWLATFLLGERFSDVPVQLPTWILLAPVLALGGAELQRRLQVVGEGREDGIGKSGGEGRWLLLGTFALAACLPVSIFFLRDRASGLSHLPGVLEILMAGLLVLWTGISLVLRGRRPALAAWVLWIACLTANLCLTFSWVGQENRQIEAYREAAMSIEAASEPGFLVVGPWSRGILWEHYSERRAYTWRWINTAWLDGTWGETWEADAKAHFQAALADRRQIWFLPPGRRAGGDSRNVDSRDELEAAGWQLEPVLDVPGHGLFWRADPPPIAIDMEGEDRGDEKESPGIREPESPEQKSPDQELPRHG